MLFSSYQNLGQILAQLAASPLIQSVPELEEKIHQAKLFHQQLATEQQGFLQEQQALQQKLSQLTRDPDEIICGEPAAPRFHRYEQMRAAGLEAQQIYWAAQQDGLDKIELLKMLRHVFQFSLPEAQSFITEAEQPELKAA